MSDSHASKEKDRSLEQALTNKIVNEYFEHSESWLRAILRMCFFSIAHLKAQPVFVVECPNHAVAKRLSRKTYPFRGIVYYLTDDFDADDRCLFCYEDPKEKTWQCFDTSTNTWKGLSNLQASTAPTDG